MSRITVSRIGTLTYIAPPDALVSEENIAELSAALKERVALRDISLVLDLVNARLVTSQALELLLDTQEQLIRLGGALHVANANGVVHDILLITGLSESLHIMSSGSKGESCVFSPPPQVSRGSKKLGNILLELGLVEPDHLDAAMKLQEAIGKRMGQILVDKEWITSRDLLKALSIQLDVPLVTLRPGIADSEISHAIPKDVAARLGVLPLFRVRNVLTVATANPQSVPIIDEIEEITQCRVRPVLAAADEISKTANEAYHTDGLLLDYIDDAVNDLELVESPTLDDYTAIDQMAEGSPVINFINTMIQRAVRDGSSDIHLEPSRGKCRIRFRIDGILYEVMSTRAEMHPALVSRLKVMANLDIAERRLPQDGRIQVFTQGRTVDLRFSSLPGIYGEKIVLRVLDRNQTILDIEKLGFSPNNLITLKRLLKRSFGLILVTGPTGSGKTTSLYGAINYLNSIEKNIVTIEDPVEYQIDIVNQNQVKDSIGLSFPKILKHVLRQDPDIVMIGEIRERETAEIAVQAALTGHLVLSTLHTNDSIGTLTRLMDMGIEPYLLSSALIGVIAQRLVRQVCPDCRTSYIAPPELCQTYGWPADKGIKLVKGRGCASCYDSGYRGRIGIHEIIETDPDLQRLMITNPARDVLVDYIRNRKIETLFDDGLARVLAGQTTIEEVSRVINA